LDICRAYLFHSLDLPFVLAKNDYDWISLLLNVPVKLGDYVRRVCIKDVDWGNRGAAVACVVKGLRQFCPKATALDISGASFPDFFDLVKIICGVKHLRSLSLQSVSWNTNTFEPTEIEECNLSVPQSLSSLRMYHSDTGPLLGWFYAHPPTVAPKITALYFGPTYCHLEPQLGRYICRHSDSFIEFGMLSNPINHSGERPLCYRDPTTQGHRCYGPVLEKTKNGVDGCPCLRISSRLRVLRFHDFLTPSAAMESGPGPVLSTIVIPRSMASVVGKFCGSLIFDVWVRMVSQVDLSMVNWEALENVLSHEAYDSVKEVIFKTWTEVSLVGLENLIARMMPRAHSRGILKFERETNISFEL